MNLDLAQLTHRSGRLSAAVGGITLVVLAPMASAQAAADPLTVHERVVDVNPGSQNPCTGDLGTVVDINDIHFHITTLADGTINENGHNTATVIFTPDDPTRPSYEGHETYAGSDRSHDGQFVTTATFSLQMKGTDGGTISIREVSHTTIGAAGAVTSFDKPVLTCR